MCFLVPLTCPENGTTAWAVLEKGGQVFLKYRVKQTRILSAHSTLHHFSDSENHSASDRLRPQNLRPLMLSLSLSLPLSTLTIQRCTLLQDSDRHVVCRRPFLLLSLPQNDTPIYYSRPTWKGRTCHLLNTTLFSYCFLSC
jgi:hypothetical protein